MEIPHIRYVKGYTARFTTGGIKIINNIQLYKLWNHFQISEKFLELIFVIVKLHFIGVFRRNVVHAPH